MLAPQAYADDARQTAPMVITATRVEQNSFDLPVAIDVVEKKDIQDGQLQMTLSESLIRVPGITAQNRTNQSQDPQISSRGFGSRSSFGVRGIRVYVDGIPLTMPDGQGQPGIVDLSAVKSIEVMRGPFSALYGNSSGGVIQLFSEDAPKTPEIGSKIMFGSYDTTRQIMDATGTTGNVEYLINASNFRTDGYRDHSSGDKQAATAKLKIRVNEDTTLTSLINWFDQKAEDPSGLDRSTAFSDPTAVVAAVTNANTRVTRSHKQIGFNLEHNLNQNNAINVMAFAGKRDNNQILATNELGTNARSSVIARDFQGTDVRWDNKGTMINMPYTLSFGLNYGKSSDARTDTNILASSITISTLNRDEDNIVDNFDQYAQAKLALLDNLDIHAGLRHTKVKLTVKDRFLTGTGNNGNNSGSVEYEKTNPVVGTVFKLSPSLNLYANYGRGFETPTFIEAAYNSTSNGIPNLTLKPSESENFELGAKAFIGNNTQANLTIFKIKTDNEIVLSETSAANRSVYSNADKTTRTGAELSIDSRFDNNISTYIAYTLLNAKFDTSFNYTPSSGTPTTVNAGNKIPGTYSNQIYAEVAWKYQPLGFSTALEGRYNSKVYVNDTNTDAAPSYKIANIRAGFEQNVGGWNFSEFVRVENIFDKDYIGSVRINDSNLRFFEPAADRNYLLSVGATYKF
ncbi:CirA Outer membrane receptor proteins, mostly Fe transport [Methylophilaceae bacterium]